MRSLNSGKGELAAVQRYLLRVKSTHYRAAALLSALPPLAESIRAAKRFRVGLLADSCTAAKSFHSITSSARASRVAGTVTPIALAVVTLMTSSTLVGNSIGRSPGFSPLRILSTK